MKRLSNPQLARAEHPLFADTALELATLELRPVLLDYGADDGSIFTALLLGETDRARAMISEDPKLIQDPANGYKVLFAALTNGHDEFAFAHGARFGDVEDLAGRMVVLDHPKQIVPGVLTQDLPSATAKPT